VIDKFDRDIIEVLRKNARISYKDLGEKVFLSANAVSERMRRLEEMGVIQGYEVKLNLPALDLPLMALMDVKMSPGTTVQEFESGLPSITGVFGATLTTGSFDYMLRLACRDQEALIRLNENLRERLGVRETYTRIVLRAIDVASPLS
jgi:Lrp/AsnC family leucine-responsive transcriptional regulator